MNNYPNYLIHYGVKGQKWGVRRYQNEDGTYTELGKQIRNKTNNYLKVSKSLSDKEYDLFNGEKGAHKYRNQDSKFMKEYFKVQPYFKDSRVVISKNRNVVLASKEFNNYVNEWSIGWATDPKARGTGATQRNIKEAIDTIRKYSNLPISATIEQENIASQKTAIKAGFKDAGYTRMNNGSVHKRYVYK